MTVPPDPYAPPPPPAGDPVAGGPFPEASGPHPGADGARRRPGAAGFVLGGLAVVLGIAAAFGFFIWAVTTPFTNADAFERVPVPGSRAIFLDEGTWSLYAEGRSSGVPRLYDPDVTVTDPEGNRVSVRSSFVSETYTSGDRAGRRIGEVRIRRAGTYTVSTTSAQRDTRGREPIESVAIGRGLWDGVLPRVLGGIGVGGALTLGGLILIIVTAVRRHRTRPPAPPRPPGPWPPGPPAPPWTGAGGAPPAPGWYGAPPGGAGPTWPPAPGTAPGADAPVGPSWPGQPGSPGPQGPTGPTGTPGRR